MFWGRRSVLSASIPWQPERDIRIRKHPELFDCFVELVVTSSDPKGNFIIASLAMISDLSVPPSTFRHPTSSSGKEPSPLSTEGARSIAM